MFDAKELLNVLTGGNRGPRAEAAAAAANDALERGKQVVTDAANQTAAAVSSALGKAQDRLQGTEAAGYVGKAKEIVSQNPVGTTAALGGLAAILLGTQGGRAVTGSAIKGSSLFVRLKSSAFRLSAIAMFAVTRGSSLLFGIGSSALPLWDQEDEVAQSGARSDRVQRPHKSPTRTHLIPRPARDIYPPTGEARKFSCSGIQRSRSGARCSYKPNTTGELGLTSTTLAVWFRRRRRGVSRSGGIAWVEAVRRGRGWLA